MSLRVKFSVVLALFGLTLALNVALSIWGIRYLERELAWPLRSAQPVLSGLHTIKRMGEQQAEALGIGRASLVRVIENRVDTPDAPSIAPGIIETEQGVLEQLEQMKEHESLQLRSGVSTSENLRNRSREIMRLAQQWAQHPSEAMYAELVSQIEARHELIERIEGRIIEDAQLVNDYGEHLRVVIYAIISIAIIGAILMSVFSVVLLRRWVMLPVEHLRLGAQRFGQGDFGHTIPITTQDELGQLGEEFNHMSSFIVSMQNERVERERLAAMGEMAQRTVHNLRTPLAGIRALAETTQRELPDNPEIQDIQARIIQSVDRFEGWLQGMLRVSSPLQLHPRAFSPSELIQGVIDAHRGAAASRSVEIRLEDSGTPARCTGDPHHLEHAFTALLSNAIDYAPSGSAIEIALSSDAVHWGVRIQDHGPGIPSELHESVFRPYFTTRSGGTGIGLALVKRIVEQHHGVIEIKSPLSGDLGPGTAFSVRFPCDPGENRSE